MDKKTVIHDYTKRYWGHNYSVIAVNEDGPDVKIKLLGWGFGLQEGHYLALSGANGPLHYRIDKVSYFDNPTDMWSAELTYECLDVDSIA